MSNFRLKNFANVFINGDVYSLCGNKQKGVLWWQIRDILEAKSPKFVLLENVDRLVKAPSKQRGRDFGIILRCFADLDYSVEYRIINAAIMVCLKDEEELSSLLIRTI